MGANVLSAKLAKVPNLLITSLATCCCNLKQHVANAGKKQAESYQRIRVECQGKYPNIKKLFGDKQNCVSRTQESAKAGRFLGKAASEQRSTKLWCIIKKSESGNKNFSRKAVFWR